MIFLVDKSEYVLKSGRKFYAHGGVLGLSTRPQHDFSEGWDGGVDSTGFSFVDRIEIGLTMSYRWICWIFDR